MRIGIECQRLLRPNKHGMEIVALELIKQLQLIDKTNEYFLFVKEDEDTNCISETANFKLVKVPAVNFAEWEQIQLPSAIKKYKLNLLHCTCNTSPYFSSTPTILTLHDIIYLENIDFSGTAYQNIGNIYRRFIVPKVVPRCKSIITVSHYEKEKIVERFKIDEERIKVVYNGVSPRFKKIDNENEISEMLGEFELPDEYILFFGNTAPKKNTKGALMAYAYYAKENKNALPLVITDLTEKTLRQELVEIKAESLRSKIKLLGYFPNQRIPYLYNRAKLMLYPSLRESFGLPIIESMACGTPVVTSNVSSMPEIAGDAAILANPSNPLDIAEGMTRLLSDDELYQSKVQKGLERASIFSWQSTAEATHNVYSCVVTNQN
jgi:glycosyltransferase involved in cell wall biosynthesis